MSMPTFHLEGIVKNREEMQDFEGPLNLILTLLNRNKIEIRDIQISQILEQYLEYISGMQEMNLEIASEFAAMASHLMYIKTRTLLHSDEQVAELDVLISSLEQLKCKDIYARVKAVTYTLGKAYEKGALLGVKPPEPLIKDLEYRYRHDVGDLLRCLLSVFYRGVRVHEDEPASRAFPKKIVYGVREKSRQIINWLRQEGDLPINRIFGNSKSRSELVATFLSILELCNMGSLRLYTGQSNEITASLSQNTDMESIIESISEEETATDEKQ